MKAAPQRASFAAQWDGDVLFGMNEAVGGHYILGYAQPPESAERGHARMPQQIFAVALQLPS